MPGFHQQAYEIIRDAAVKVFGACFHLTFALTNDDIDVSSDKVEVLDFQHDSLETENQRSDAVSSAVLPPFPLEPGTKATRSAAKTLQKWFTSALSLCFYIKACWQC
jgi:hypothetical protein